MVDERLDFFEGYPKGTYRIKFLCTLDWEQGDLGDKGRFEKDFSWKKKVDSKIYK